MKLGIVGTGKIVTEALEVLKGVLCIIATRTGYVILIEAKDEYLLQERN